MRVLLPIFILFILENYVDAAKKNKKTDSTSSKTKAAAQEDAGPRRLKEIIKLDTSIVTLTDANFSTYISDRPRVYHAAIMFTALADKYQCTICESSRQLWEEASRLYKDQYNLETTAPENRVVFFLVDVDSSRTIFGQIGIESVPRMILLPPRELNGPKQKISNYEMNNHEAVVGGVKAILNEIQRMAGIQINVTVEPKPVLLMLICLSIFMAWLVNTASKDIHAALLWYRSSRIWIVISMVCFGVGVSGSIYCIIRSTPLFGAGREGVTIFSGQNRDQYVIEGIILALFSISAAMSLVAMHYMTKIPFALLRHIGVIFCMSVFTVMLLQIWLAYTDKTRWYSLKDTLPPQLWTWISSSVKKSTSLPKRLFRLSEYWLFEAKDWDALWKKMKVLVVDYINRTYFNKAAAATSAN
eukprot:gene4551-9030_t